jgi:uncharacterized membrane protein YfcA
VNWILNAVILVLIIGSYIAYRMGDYIYEKRLAGLLVIIMVITVFYGVRKLQAMQAEYDLRCPPAKKDKDKDNDQ